MAYVSQADWDFLVTEIESSGFFSKPIIWKKANKKFGRYQEDDTEFGPDITLNALSNYNYMRSWPVSIQTESGEIDRESIQLIFLVKEFRDLNLLNAQGYPLIDPSLDRFVFNGHTYKMVGDTLVSQAGGKDVLFTVIVKREETNTGDFR